MGSAECGGRRAREPVRQRQGFLGRVAGERVGVLDHRRRAGKFLQREAMEVGAEDGLDFSDLVGVAGGDEQRGHNCGCIIAKTRA